MKIFLARLNIFCPLFKPLQTLRPVFGYVLMAHKALVRYVL